LLRHKRARLVSLASAADIAVQIGTVVFFAVAVVGSEGHLTGSTMSLLRLPACCVYSGVLARLLVCCGGYLYYVDLPATPVTAAGKGANGFLLGSGVIETLMFAYPLALTNLAANATRPLVNLAVSRSSDGTDGVAVLTACYPLVHFVYGWLNMLK